MLRILELGLREPNITEHTELVGVAQILEILAGLPSPEEVLALRPSRRCSSKLMSYWRRARRLACLRMRSGCGSSTNMQYEYIEHFVRMAKAKAVLKLKAA